MKIERTQNAKRNIIFGIIQKIYTLLVPFLIRTAMIYFMGVKYIGLGSLFTSILTVLNLTELGVGGALVFSMYKPIAEDNKERICALMRLYRTYYRVIGTVIMVIGVALTPIIPKLVKGEVPSDVNLIILYYLNLAATVLSYFLFAYKNSLLTAHQRNDVGSKIGIIISTIQYVLQLIVIVWGNYYLYVIVALATTAISNIVTAIVVDKMYPEYQPKGKLSKEEIRVINHRIRDLFTSKIGSVIVDSADTIVISAFLGLQLLAIYNNYYYIMTSLFGFIGIIFSSCTAGIGNSLVTDSSEKNYNDLKKFLLIISWIAGVCVSCLLCLFQPFMKIWVGDELMLSFEMVICFCCYFFIHEVNRLINTYKDAAGIWHEDRFRPLVTGIVNVILNLILVNYIGLFGILLSTIISMVLVGMPWLIHNLFTVIFQRNAVEFIIKLFQYVLVTVVSCVITYQITQLFTIKNSILGFLIQGMIVFCVANIIFFIAFCRTKEYKEVKNMILNMIKR